MSERKKLLPHNYNSMVASRRLFVRNMAIGAGGLIVASGLGWLLFNPSEAETKLPFVNQEPPKPQLGYDVNKSESALEYIHTNVIRQYGLASLHPEMLVTLSENGPMGEAGISTNLDKKTATVDAVTLRTRYSNGDLVSAEYQSAVSWKETLLHLVSLNGVLKEIKASRLSLDLSNSAHQGAYLSLVDGIAFLMQPLAIQQMNEITKFANGTKVFMGFSTPQNLSRYPTLYQANRLLEFGSSLTRKDLSDIAKLEIQGSIMPGFMSISPLVDHAITQGAFQNLGQ